MDWIAYSEEALESFRERLEKPAAGHIRVVANGPEVKARPAWIGRGPGGRIRLAVEGYGWDGVVVTHFFEPTDPEEIFA